MEENILSIQIVQNCPAICQRSAIDYRVITANKNRFSITGANIKYMFQRIIHLQWYEFDKFVKRQAIWNITRHMFYLEKKKLSIYPDTTPRCARVY